MTGARVLVGTLLGALLALSFVPHTHGFLATPLNTTDPDVIDILCPDQTEGVTRDHKWITREAIRRNIRQFFIDNPPEDDPDFIVPSTASLTELYHAYYGAHSSPARFINAINTIAKSNVKADSSKQTRYDPSIHADGEVFDDYTMSMSKRYPQILSSIMENEAFTAARGLLGTSLHSLQKFYAHSSWVELGNNSIIENLGLPWFDGFDHVATADESVCTPCDSSQGECHDNVIQGAGLTTGFYTYNEVEAVDFLIEKPDFGGKCSHGGVLDESSGSPAQGGINKDTASPCFSPHFYLHEQAAELAVKATDHYLNVILDAIGVDSYRQLFDLYHGSALSVVVDTTSSMDKEIAAVKKQVAEIVESFSPKIYILVPYNDPSVGPVTRTEDPDEFLAAINGLVAGGGGDLPEMFWSGLQLALTNTPEYGNIFCFTDDVGKDGDKMEGDLAIATSQKTKVTMIYSGIQVFEEEKSTQEGDNMDAPSLTKVTTIQDYHDMADRTGGLFIHSDKFSIDEIVPILDEGVESITVDIIQRRGNTGESSIDIPIDDSIFDFEVRLTGTPDSCIMTSVDGKQYDVMDEDALAGEPEVEIIAYSTSIRAVKWHNPSFGIWNFQVNDPSNTYSINVMANSTLNWLGGFAVLDPSPPHPHYQDNEGKPLTNTIYYLDINLIGYIESKVKDVDHILYVNTYGDELMRINYDGDVDDEFYVRSDILPEENFYIQVFGHIDSGNVFCRLLPILMEPVDLGVEVDSTSEDLSAKPGERKTGHFTVTNYGLTSDFTITGTDVEGYLASVSPAKVNIPQNETVTIDASFFVPLAAIPGTVSKVTITAASLKQSQSVNSAIADFTVLAKEEDFDLPLCTMDSQPDCEGFRIVGLCHEKNWTANATLQDTGSGMSSIRVTPNDFFIDIGDFTTGTNDPVQVQVFGDCCVKEVDIIGVDVVGNPGKCHVDLGPMGGGIINFRAIEVGTTWVNLEWELISSSYDISKYSLVVNEDISMEFHETCTDCTYNATDLDPCLLQHFQLTPYFAIDDTTVAGENVYTDATTLATDIEAPTNGLVTDIVGDGFTVTWDAEKSPCISEFKVCARPVNFEGSETCLEVTENTAQFTGLQACADYEIEITPVDIEGKDGAHSLIVTAHTAEGDLAMPSDLVADVVDAHTVILRWSDPEKNALCIHTYQVRHHEVHANDLSVENSKYVRQNHTFNVMDLHPCTNYSFKVYPVSNDGTLGPHAEVFAMTSEIEVGAVNSLMLSDVSKASMKISWQSNMECVDHFKVCYYNEVDVGETCDATKDTHLTINDLMACTNYFTSVSLVTYSGFVGQKTTKKQATLDAAPESPQNLTISHVDASSISVQFVSSDVNPKCSNTFETDIAEVSAISTHHSKGKPIKNMNGDLHEHSFSHLDACTNYLIKAKALSTSGLASDWVSVTTTTTEATPSTARAFDVYSKTMTDVDFTWFIPEENGNCAYTYTLSWSDGSETIGPAAEGQHLPYEVEHKVTGLTACTDYTFNLTPNTPSGVEGPSVSIEVKTQC